jgi:hypothetical protein
MANLRNLKKDINYLCGEVMSDCMAFIYFNPDKNSEQSYALLDEIFEFRDQLFTRVYNAPKGVDRDVKETKAYFKAINKDLMEGCNTLFEKISTLATIEEKK